MKNYNSLQKYDYDIFLKTYLMKRSDKGDPCNLLEKVKFMLKIVKYIVKIVKIVFNHLKKNQKKNIFHLK